MDDRTAEPEMEADKDDRPIDGARWGEWNRGAFERWEIVRRSWTVFARNTSELIELLKRPATDLVFSLGLMGDDRDATTPFWDELDQRLHNQLAGAATLVDHTRRLTSYYADDVPELADEFEARNKAVMAMDDSAFLRKLGNYLLHYGVAQSFRP